jgi:hypothetical protein
MLFVILNKKINSSTYCYAAVLGCSTARGCIQLILLVMLLPGGLIWRLWASFFDVFVDARLTMV